MTSPIDRSISLTEDVDVAIRIGTLADSNLIARKLTTIELWPCANPSYLADHGTPSQPEDLLDHKLLTWSDRPSLWVFPSPNGAQAQVDVAPGTVVPEPGAALVMLVGGAGIGRLSDFMAHRSVVQGELVRLFPNLQPETVDAYAVYPSRRSLSAKVRVFIDALAAHLKAQR